MHFQRLIRSLLALMILLLLGIALFLFHSSSSEPGTSPIPSAPTLSIPEDRRPAPLPFPEEKLSILHEARLSVEAAQDWALGRGASLQFVTLAPLVWELATAKGLDPLVVYCQSALETGFMHFTGVLNEDFHNPCGMKIQAGGGDTDQNAHMRFPDWETGFSAQIDHLALYAGKEGYPLEESPDPRHFPYLWGTAPTVEDLGEKWVPHPDYGKIIRKMMEEAHAYQKE